MADVIKSIGTGKDYTTIAAWESDLDNGAVYSSGDNAIGELYNQEYAEQATVNGGGTIGLTSVTLRANSAERHTGRPGTGPRIVWNFNPFWGSGASTPTYNFEWFEYDFDGGDDSEIISLQTSSTTRCRNLIVHNAVHTSTTFNCYGIRSRGTSDNHELENCLVFNVELTGAGQRLSGILLSDTTTGKIRNCTVTDIRQTSGTSGDSQGINFLDTASHTIQNNLVTDIQSTAGTASCYDNSSVTNAVTAGNVSDDATSPQTSLRNKTISYRNSANRDYRLAAGDTDAVGVGSDLGTGAVAVDLLGYDRDAGGVTWDAGAFQYFANTSRSFRVVTGLTNATATGTADFTVPGFGTPAGAIVYINSATDSANPNTTSTIHFLTMGYWDGTNQISKAESSHDGLSSPSFTVSNKYMMNDKIGHYVNDSGTVQAEWSISNITNGVRITTDTSDSSQHQCMVILIPSSGVSNISAFIQDWSTAVPGPGGAAAVTVSSLSFEADLVFSMCGVNPTVDTIDDSIQSGWGIVHNVDGTDANIVQMSTGWTINDARDLASQTTWTSTGSWNFYGLINLTNSGTPRFGVRFTGFGGTGWTMTKYTDENTNPPTTKMTATFGLEEDTMHLAIAFVGAPDIKLFQPDAPNAVGPWATTSPGFEPKFGMMFTPRHEDGVVNNVTGTGDTQSITVFDEDAQNCIGYLDQDNVSTTYVSTYLDTGLQVYEDQNVNVYDATFRGFDANGWTWNFTTVFDTTNQDPWIALAIGDIASVVITDVDTDETWNDGDTGLVITGTGFTV